MPSGAKKRKAAKKKLEKQAHSFTSTNGSHPFPQEIDDQKFHDERGSDGGDVDVEREGNVEKGGVNNHDDESAKGVSLGEENVAERVKQKEESFKDVVDDTSREFLSATNKSSSTTSSSTSSSSSDDEVVVEKEEPEETELVIPSDSVEESIENSVDESFKESIPKEELVKEVSLPQEPTIVSESVTVDDLSTSDVIASELEENLDEVVNPFDEKSEVASEVVELIPEKIEEKVIPVVDGDSENIAEPVSVTVRKDEEFPQSSAAGAVEGCHNDNGKVPETQKYEEEQPLISSAPIPVRRTSWLNCCGLFEVFSGGSS